MGKVINLSDKDLHSMIKESVKCILQERWTSADDNASSFYRLKAQRDKVAKDIFMSWLAQQEPGSREMREIDWPYVSYFDGVFTVKHDREIGDEEVIDGMKFVWIWDQRCDGGWTVKRELPDEEIARYAGAFRIKKWETIYSPTGGSYGDEEIMRREPSEKLRLLYRNL